MQCPGILYAVGVGPGVPDLLTVRALEVLRRVDVILAAASPKNDASAALETVQSYLKANVRLERLDFPMTRNAEERKKAWEKAAMTTRAILESGLDAAFLTIGDPLIYSTFGYLLKTLHRIAPKISVSVIPGITSFQAAAAKTCTVLCEDEESLLILPGIRNQQSLTEDLGRQMPTVVLKAYRNLPAIFEAFTASNRLEGSILASLVEREGESIGPLSAYSKEKQMQAGPKHPPYMSLILSIPKRTE